MLGRSTSRSSAKPPSPAKAHPIVQLKKCALKPRVVVAVPNFEQEVGLSTGALDPHGPEASGPSRNTPSR
jgi:hypothetical protein